MKTLSFSIFSLFLQITYLSAQTYEAKGVGGGGALSGFSISPYSDHWFVGTDMGTLYRSANEGEDWYPVSHFETTFSNDLPNACYIGFNPDTSVFFHAYEGCKPQRSSDGGHSWNTITSLQNLLPTTGYDFADCKNDANATRIRYWISDSFDENIVFAASGDGLFRSADKGINWIRINNISGASKGTFIDYATNPHTVYHANESGIYQSTDAGLTFSLYQVDNVRSFSGGRDASGLTLVYINDDPTACNSTYTNRYGNPEMNCGFIQREINGGGFIDTGEMGGDWIRMAENNSQTIYTTGARVWNLSYGTQIWLSDDAGNSYNQVFQQLLTVSNPWSPWPATSFDRSAIGLDIGYDDAGYRSFSINRRDATQAGGTGNYFLHTTKNKGNFWLSPFTQFEDNLPKESGKRWSSRGLEQTSAWLLKFHPNNDQLGYVGYADLGGKVTEDGGDTWRICQGIYNSIYDFAFLPNDDNQVFSVMSNRHDFPYEWYGNYFLTGSVGGVFHSLDRGRNWTRMTPDDAEYNMAFLSIAYDEVNNILYAGSQGRGVARSTDGGTTWNWINTGLPTMPKIVPQIEIDPVSRDVYIILTGDKPDFTDITATGIYKMDYGTSTWNILRGTVHAPTHPHIGPLWKYPVHFAVDWTDTNRETIWLLDNQIPGMYKASGVWLTEDGGTNWYHKLIFSHAHRVAIDPNDHNVVFVNGQGEGPQHTEDKGATWQRNMDLPMQYNLTAMTFDPTNSNKVYYTFFGGGMMYGDKPVFTFLPLEILDFKYACNDNEIEIKLELGEVINVEELIIQKSTDGMNWRDALIIPAPNSFEKITSKILVNNEFYIRIKSKDYDGTIETFDVEKINCNSDLLDWNIHPNPSREKLTISCSVDNFYIVVSDVTGRVVYEERFKENVGVLDWRELGVDKGVYFIKIERAGAFFVEKIVVN